MAEKIKLGTNGNFGVKEGGTLAYNDENGVFKAIELASSRSSSATYVAESGLIADAEVGVPRIDWTNGVGELLLEPQSTNLITYSEDFTKTDWTSPSTATLSATTTIAPDGSQNAVRVTNTSGTVEDLRDLVAITSGVSYTASAYIRRVSGSGDVHICDVNGFEGSAIAVTSEWQRFEATVVSSSTTGRLYVRTYGLNDEIEVWGCQIEQQSYATSYIRTEGSQVTRIADAVTGNSSLGQVINSSEGVLYAEMSALADDLTGRRICLSTGSFANCVNIYYDVSTNYITGQVRNGGADQGVVFSNNEFDITQNLKIALKWKANDFALWINGTERSTDNSGSVPSGLNKLSFDNGVGSDDYFGRIRDLRVYDTALTDAELTTLTTI